ncbi:S41 family peptidase [uncultured Polaribacter sp.]|uniref:S41 family peptidase n=1 Tax=uncultured Polaribacter sp. TaxID=174711 RepID=UPI002606848F|nr:S41 family peptidase [uncultured Polaribacter sp.]
MTLKFFKKIAVVLLMAITYYNCSSEKEQTPQEIKVHTFAWKGLNAYYLWQSSVLELQDNYFNNQNELNSFLAAYDSPESLFESLLNRPTDRFSWMVEDYNALENSFQGINVSTGMEFGLKRYKDNDTKVYGYVRYVVPNSSAAINNVERGMIFNAVNGTQLTDTNYNSLLFDSNANLNIELASYNDGNPISNGTFINLTKEQVVENPVAIYNIIPENGKKIGYLLYNQFSSAYDAQLNAAFNFFKAENIDELIVDLRYNGGGSVKTATYLGSMITGQFDEQVYSKEVWNEKVQNAISEDRFLNYFTDEILNFDQNENIVLQEPINSLNLTKAYFIVTGSTASASELVINSLRAYIDVAIIGTTTVGKQVGSVTLYDSDNLTKTGINLNPNHTYAIQPIVLEISNKDNQNELLGFTPGVTLPGVEIAEDYGNLGVLGNKTEPLLQRTLSYITNGARANVMQSVGEYSEIYNSKLATPTGNNMYVNLKK